MFSAIPLILPITSDSQKSASRSILCTQAYAGGGKEPLAGPLGGWRRQFSVWYDFLDSTDLTPGPTASMEVTGTSNPFPIDSWGSARLIYTTPRPEHYIALGLMGGAVINADRFSAYRLGGDVSASPWMYPLFLPGYFYEELSAQNFGLLYGLYAIPVGSILVLEYLCRRRTSLVDYLDGLDLSPVTVLWALWAASGLSRKIAGERRCSLPATASMRSAVTDEADIVWPSCCRATSTRWSYASRPRFRESAERPPSPFPVFAVTISLAVFTEVGSPSNRRALGETKLVTHVAVQGSISFFIPHQVPHHFACPHQTSTQANAFQELAAETAGPR